ncbi:hypothetical protein [Streptomyces sp. cg36]|uniref:hypothetical protein n=1 Tax=Streptomyces sp. cg36 TaxID=3238798 RepID=UPI0034E25C0A
MSGTDRYEAPASDTVLLAFDGRVLEVFGYVDDARYHVWEGPRLDFTTGRFRRLAITVRSGRRHSIPYDEQRLPALRALADRIARSVAEGRGPG